MRKSKQKRWSVIIVLTDGRQVTAQSRLTKKEARIVRRGYDSGIYDNVVASFIRYVPVS